MSRFSHPTGPWRGHANGNVPVALGFDFWPVVIRAGLPAKAFLRKVVYDPKEQEQQVADVIRTWLETVSGLLRSGVEPKALFPYPAIWSIQEALVEHHLCFENPAFSEEQEWRLIRLVDFDAEMRLLADRRHEAEMARFDAWSGQLGTEISRPPLPSFPRTRADGIEVSFRASTSGLVPYIELPLETRPETCSKHRVARLMREANLRALHGYRTRRWSVGKPSVLIPNLLQRD